MKNLVVRFRSLPVAALAGSIVLVGLVWAGTAAQEDTTPDTTIPIDSIPDDSVPPGEDLESLIARVESLEAEVVELTGRLDEALVRVEAALARVDEFAAKVSQLGDDGTYTGTLRPAQIVPKLKVGDILGEWPLNRTQGKLGSDRLSIAVNGCSSDSRYWSVLTLSSFREFTCLRIPK